MTPDSSEDPSLNASPPDSRADAAPKDLDYELVRQIGRGAYGEVWLVRNKSGNYYACKVVYRESFQHDRPYEREYEGICKFEPVSRSSESQIKILHVGRRDSLGYFYYLMEVADDASTGRTIEPDHYIPRTLYHELKSKKKLPAKECIEIGISLSSALENLHRHGLIHRDIKPGNIIFVDGVPKLADIGLVTDLDVSISYVGTEGFIPPEGPTSSRADIYGLGKVLYEISTGKDRLQYPELPDDFADIPDWDLLLELNAVIARACESNPSRRYASARALRMDLDLLASGKSIRKRRSLRRHWALAGQTAAIGAAIVLMISGLVYLFHVPPDHGQNPPKSVSAKIPVPDAARLAQCESKLEQDYQYPLKNGDSDSKQKAAAELYNQSVNESDPAMALASLRVAARLAVEASNYSRAMEICDKMSGRFDMDILPIKTDLLSQAAGSAQTTKNQADLADLSVVTGFQAIAGDDYPMASKLAGLAKSAAQLSGDAALIWQAGFLADETDRCAPAYGRLNQAATTLNKNPDDPSANLAMGKFLCFIKNDWATGLPLMARGSDETVRSIANQEIADMAKGPPRQVALGDAWWKLSVTASDNESGFYQARARYWYLKAIASSKEPERTSLRQSLSDHLNAVPTQPAEVHIVSRVSGTEFIDIYSDQTEWTSSQRGATENKINQVSPGDFGEGDFQIIKNCGPTWLMPDAVDFASARLDNDHKEHRGERAKLLVFADHVRVILSHQRIGSGAFDLTVIFGGKP
ncbi:MAG TPA: serine/threonine-protein kinase [Verrucomicrobiae bacterium]